MGLDASVFCNCYEQGQLRSLPPAGCTPLLSEDGSLTCDSDDLNLQLAFDAWRREQACEHQGGYLVAHYIGNIALVAFLREQIARWPDRFPMILSRVVYNGMHCGDFIASAELSQLVPEIRSLAALHCVDPEEEEFLRMFEKQMCDLLACALRVSKPIAF
jgi:hypothetical protein